MANALGDKLSSDPEFCAAFEAASGYEAKAAVAEAAGLEMPSKQQIKDAQLVRASGGTLFGWSIPSAHITKIINISIHD